MNIYLVRHGKDDDNYRGGWSSLSITEEGKNEVKKTAVFLKQKQMEYNIQKIISSDLRRTKETAEIINEVLNVPIEYTERLRETNNGIIAGMKNTEVEKLYPGLYFSSLEMNERYPGGESPIEFYNRITNDFEKILEENSDIDNLLIVTHSGVINILYDNINNTKWSNKLKHNKVENAGIYKMTIDENERSFDFVNLKEY